MGSVYSYAIKQETLLGGGVTIIPLDAGYRWVVRDILGIITNPSKQDSALEFSTLGNRFARFACPPEGVIPMKWEARFVVPLSDEGPGPPPPPALEVAAIGLSSVVFEYYIGGYQLGLP